MRAFDIERHSLSKMNKELDIHSIHYLIKLVIKKLMLNTESLLTCSMYLAYAMNTDSEFSTFDLTHFNDVSLSEVMMIDIRSAKRG